MAVGLRGTEIPVYFDTFLISFQSLRKMRYESLLLNTMSVPIAQGTLQKSKQKAYKLEYPEVCGEIRFIKIAT